MTNGEWQRKQLDKQQELLKKYPEDVSQTEKDIWNLKWMATGIGYQSRYYRMGGYASLQRAIKKMEASEFMSKKSELGQSMEILVSALSEDKSPGSYYYTWQSNIACTIMDNSDLGHEKANEIAIKFLDILIGGVSYVH